MEEYLLWMELVCNVVEIVLISCFLNAGGMTDERNFSSPLLSSLQ